MKQAKSFVAMLSLMIAAIYAIGQIGISMPTLASLLLLIGEVAADTTTTYLCLKKHGAESNPVVAFLFKKLGYIWTFVLVWAVWAWLITGNFLRTNELTQTAFVIVYGFVPVNNLVVLWRLSKKEEKK